MRSQPDFQAQQQNAKGKNGKQPSSPLASEERGRQEVGGKKPEGKTERVDREARSGDWGRLPPYLQLMFKKRGTPRLPSKYERYREAFHKAADRKRTK